MAMALTENDAEVVEVPVFALAALLERAGLGEPHLVLQPEAVWRHPDELAVFDDAVRDALTEAGVLRGRDEVDRNLMDLLPLLVAPAIEYYGWFTVDGEIRGALAAAGAMDAVIAVRAGDHVRLAAAARDRLAEALLAELPVVSPGAGEMVMVTAADLEQLHAPAGPNARDVPPHVTELLRAVKRPVLGGGELFAASRDQVGRRTVRGPVRYADTEQGRFLNYSTGAGRTLELVHAPATQEALIAALDKAENPRR